MTEKQLLKKLVKLFPDRHIAFRREYMYNRVTKEFEDTYSLYIANGDNTDLGTSWTAIYDTFQELLSFVKSKLPYL